MTEAVGRIESNLIYLLLRKRRAFMITETELRLMANAAIMGDSKWPVKGYKSPAANGIPRAL